MEDILPPLFYLISQEGFDGYKIFYGEELLQSLPQEARNAKTLEGALQLLADGGYIDVKYARGDTFCIAALKEYCTPQKAKQRQNSSASVAIIALAAFCGSVLGCGIVFLISAVI